MSDPQTTLETTTSSVLQRCLAFGSHLLRSANHPACRRRNHLLGNECIAACKCNAQLLHTSSKSRLQLKREPISVATPMGTRLLLFTACQRSVMQTHTMRSIEAVAATCLDDVVEWAPSRRRQTPRVKEPAKPLLTM
eukprot:3806498-Amphidinium_carterae.1